MTRCPGCTHNNPRHTVNECFNRRKAGNCRCAHQIKRLVSVKSKKKKR